MRAGTPSLAEVGRVIHIKTDDRKEQLALQISDRLTLHRNQGYPQIAQPVQEAVERRLVCRGNQQKGFVRLRVIAPGQTEPVQEGFTQAALDAHLVTLCKHILVTQNVSSHRSYFNSGVLSLTANYMKNKVLVVAAHPDSPAAAAFLRAAEMMAEFLTVKGSVPEGSESR